MFASNIYNHLIVFILNTKLFDRAMKYKKAQSKTFLIFLYFDSLDDTALRPIMKGISLDLGNQTGLDT